MKKFKKLGITFYYQEYSRCEFQIGVDWTFRPVIFFIHFLFWSFELELTKEDRKSVEYIEHGNNEINGPVNWP